MNDLIHFRKFNKSELELELELEIRVRNRIMIRIRIRIGSTCQVEKWHI